jgi:hypothetical protein
VLKEKSIDRCFVDKENPYEKLNVKCFSNLKNPKKKRGKVYILIKVNLFYVRL